jgi:hypothetical protein
MSEGKLEATYRPHVPATSVRYLWREPGHTALRAQPSSRPSAACTNLPAAPAFAEPAFHRSSNVLQSKTLAMAANRWPASSLGLASR